MGSRGGRRRWSVRAAFGAILVLTATLAGNVLGQAHSPTQTASAPAAGVQRIDLPGGGFYWLKTPAHYKRGDRAPLVLCLHGTDEPAADALAFWSAMGLPQGAVWAAPQAVGRGWSDADLAHLRETWADLTKRVTFDRARVLLAGFSAGGAMAFHLAYREEFPASALVTLGNYMPPGVTAAEVLKRKHVPVFYGVGTEDINHERMRAGVALLREQGVHVTLVRPPIGHVLSPDVGRAALAWFDELGREAVVRRLDEAAVTMHRNKPAGYGRAAVQAELVLTQARWQDPESVKRAESLLAQALSWGRGRLAEADRLIQDRQQTPQHSVDAVMCLREIEQVYAGASLADEARARREKIEADPAVRQALADKERRRREQEAMSLFLDVQRLVADGKLDEARRVCETITSGYADTPAAGRARNLLSKLPAGTKP